MRGLQEPGIQAPGLSVFFLEITAHAPPQSIIAIFQLLEPVKAHRLDDAAVHHDDARLAGARVEVLVGAIRGNIDEIPDRPFELLRLWFPPPPLGVPVFSLLAPAS